MAFLRQPCLEKISRIFPAAVVEPVKTFHISRQRLFQNEFSNIYLSALASGLAQRQLA